MQGVVINHTRKQTYTNHIILIIQNIFIKKNFINYKPMKYNCINKHYKSNNFEFLKLLIYWFCKSALMWVTIDF